MDNLTVGKLYYYDRPDRDKISFEEKLKILLAEHQSKYDWEIHTCLIHPNTLNGENIQDQDVILGIKIVFYWKLIKDNFWFFNIF